MQGEAGTHLRAWVRDCTAPIPPSTQARRAAMAKKRKAKAKAKKTAKRRKKK
jgi:hypothetical protein